MSKVSIEESTLSAIGDAIRKKTGESALLSPLDMPTAIGSISGGGGGDDEDSPFIYTKTEKQIEKEIRARLGYPAPPPLQFEGEVMIVQFSKLGEYLKIPKCYTPANGSPLAYAAEIYGVNNGQWEMFAHYDINEGDTSSGVYERERNKCVNIEGAFTTLETYEGYILVRSWGKSSDYAMLATDYNSYRYWSNIVELKEYFYTTTPRGYTEYYSSMYEANDYSNYWPNHLEIVTFKGGNDYDHALNVKFNDDFCFGMAKLIKTENESGKIYIKHTNNALIQPCYLVGKRGLLSTPNFYLYNINNSSDGSLNVFFNRVHIGKDGNDARTLRTFYYAPYGSDSSTTSSFSNNPAANRYTHIQVPVTGLLPYSGTQSNIWFGSGSCNNPADIEFVMDDKLYNYFKKNPGYNGCYTLYCLCGTTWDASGMNYINVPMCYLNNFPSSKQITIKYAEGFTFDKRPGLSNDASVDMKYIFLNSNLDYDKFIKSLPTDISAFKSVTLSFDTNMVPLSKEQKEYITSLGYIITSV